MKFVYPKNISENERSAALQRKLQRHFLTCSAAIGAAAAFAPAQEAQATIHYFDPADIQITVNDLAGIYFNLETGAFGTSAAAVPGWDINIFNPSAGNIFARGPGNTGIVGYIGAGNEYVSRLAPGSYIDPAATFVGWSNPPTVLSLGNTAGQWTGTVSGFIGVYFALAAANSTVFGWIHVDIVNGVVTVTDWAWEENKDPIKAGAIPEPSTLALSFLAAGAAGLAYWRKRKAGLV